MKKQNGLIRFFFIANLIGVFGLAGISSAQNKAVATMQPEFQLSYECQVDEIQPNTGARRTFRVSGSTALTECEDIYGQRFLKVGSCSTPGSSVNRQLENNLYLTAIFQAQRTENSELLGIQSAFVGVGNFDGYNVGGIYGYTGSGPAGVLLRVGKVIYPVVSSNRGANAFLEPGCSLVVTRTS